MLQPLPRGLVVPDQLNRLLAIGCCRLLHTHTVAQEQLNNLRVPKPLSPARPMDWGKSVRCHVVGVVARLEQQLRDLGVTCICSRVQRGVPLAVWGCHERFVRAHLKKCRDSERS